MPTQPVYTDESGTIRFVPNRIVEKILENSVRWYRIANTGTPKKGRWGSKIIRFILSYKLLIYKTIRSL